MKRILILITLVFICFLLVGCGSNKERDFIHDLENGLVKRDLLTPAVTQTEYEALIEAEAETAAFAGTEFENTDLNTYLEGLLEQKDSLQYFESDSEKFYEMWNDGSDKRTMSVLSLVENNVINISDELYSSFAVQKLERSFYDKLIGTMQWSYDEHKQQYYRSFVVKNDTNLTLQDVEVDVWVGQSNERYTISQWKPKQVWSVTVYLANDDIENEHLEVAVQFLKYKYNNIVIDNSDIMLYDTNDKESKADNASDNSSLETDQKTQHYCDASGCINEGTHSMIGISGQMEYYCDEHYQEMKDMLDMIEKDVANSSSDSSGNSSLITYDATLEYGSGSVLICASEEAMSRYMTALDKGNQGTIDEMIANGEIAWTSKGTKCNIVNQKISKCQVKLLDGAYAGNTVWVVSESIKEAK